MREGGEAEEVRKEGRGESFDADAAEWGKWGKPLWSFHGTRKKGKNM